MTHILNPFGTLSGKFAQVAADCRREEAREVAARRVDCETCEGSGRGILFQFCLACQGSGEMYEPDDEDRNGGYA
jgi:RecJ-like exonuclease